MYIVHCTLYIVHCTLYIVHCTLYIVHCTLYTVHCTLYIVHCTLYIVHCTLCIVHCTLYIVHCTLYIVHRTLYTVHCTPPYFTVSFSDNGIWKGKKYFHCKDGHGLIVPFNAVCRCSVASKRPPLSGNVLVGNPRTPRIPCVQIESCSLACYFLCIYIIIYFA